MTCARMILPLLVIALTSSFGARGSGQAPDAGITSDVTVEATRAPQRAAAHPASGRMTLYVGLYLNELREVDSRTQTYRADLYYWLRYTARGEGDHDADMENIEFVNGELETDDEQERKRIGDQIYVIHRARGRFHFLADYRRYPFDVQHFPIEVEHVSVLLNDLEIRPDMHSYRRSGVDMRRVGLGENVALPDMVINRVRHQTASHTYHSDFGDPTVVTRSSTYSRYRMTVDTQRVSTSFFIKILIPLAIIQILAYLVFFVPADRLDVAVGLTVTSLLASIAFQITLSDSLPDIGYLTTADHIFHLSYFMVMAAMAQTVMTFNLEANGRAKLADQIEGAARWLYPMIFFGMLWLISSWL